MKKILITGVIILIGVAGYLIYSGTLTIKALKSDALNADTCSPTYIREKAEAYHQASFNLQEDMNQIAAIKAEILKLEAQKDTASDVEQESIIANITAQEKALEILESAEENQLIAEYEACKQDLLFK